jgi:cytochrome P450
MSLMPKSHSPLAGALRFPHKVANPGGILLGLLSDPLEQLTRWANAPGDIICFREWGETFYLVKTPQLVHEVLVSKGRHFKKGRSLERLRKIVGNGLLTSEGDFYLRQRRLIQPLFHARTIRDCVETMVAETVSLMTDWHDGETRDISHDMMRLTLNIVSQTILGSDDDPEALRIRQTMDTMMRSFPILMLPFANLLEHLPLPAIKRLRKVRAELDEIVYGLIAERRTRPKERRDLLTMLLNAQDPEGEPGDRMSDEQVRDEVLIMIIAGHETTATAFSWIWFLLAQHPEIESKLHAEIDQVLSGARLPTAEDFSALSYTRQVVNEAMRIRPPVWTIARRATSACEIGGYQVPPDTIMLMSQWLLHRDPKLFEDPLEFRPERWKEGFEGSLPKTSYFPFGGGLRRCIGENFALMELVLSLATIAQRWRFRVNDPAKVVPQPLFTLRLKNGLPVTLQRR